MYSREHFVSVRTRQRHRILALQHSQPVSEALSLQAAEKPIPRSLLPRESRKDDEDDVDTQEMDIDDDMSDGSFASPRQEPLIAGNEGLEWESNREDEEELEDGHGSDSDSNSQKSQTSDDELDDKRDDEVEEEQEDLNEPRNESDELENLKALSGMMSFDCHANVDFQGFPSDWCETFRYFRWKRDSAVSDRTYEKLRLELEQSGVNIKSLRATRRYLERLLGIHIVTYDRCKKNCMAFTGRSKLRGSCRFCKTP